MYIQKKLIVWKFGYIHVFTYTFKKLLTFIEIITIQKVETNFQWI